MTAAGEDSYAQRLSAQARAFRHSRSSLERALNRLLLAHVAALVPLVLILGTSLVLRDSCVRQLSGMPSAFDARRNEMRNPQTTRVITSRRTPDAARRQRH